MPTTSTHPVNIAVMRLPHADGLGLPEYATLGSAGMDLRAAVESTLVLEPGARLLIPTGFAVALPEGFEGQVRPRSGLAVHHGVTVLNSPGTIDSDYRGEVKVLLVSLGTEPFAVQRGDRIAQLVISPIVRAEITEHDTLPATVRGAGGFGHTGK